MHFDDWRAFLLCDHTVIYHFTASGHLCCFWFGAMMSGDCEHFCEHTSISDPGETYAVLYFAMSTTFLLKTCLCVCEERSKAEGLRETCREGACRPVRECGQGLLER